MQRSDYKICELPFPVITSERGRNVDYEVFVDGVSVYRGRAYSTGVIQVNIQKIVEDYLGAEHIDISASALTLQYEEDGFKEVEVRLIEGEENYSVLVWYGVIRSYDYGWIWEGESATLSEPINGKIDARMQFLYSVYRATDSEGINYGIVPKVTITPSVINASAAAEQYQLTIDSNVPYAVSVDSQWFSAEQDETNPSIWIVETDSNTGATRTGVLSVIYEDEYGRQVTSAVQVIQGEPYIEVIPSAITVAAAASGYTFTVTSNMPYNISSTSEWVSFSATSGGSGTTEFTVYVGDNSEYDARTATVSVGYKTFEINQEEVSITLVPSAITATAAGGQYTVTATSNCPFDVESVPSWITVSPASGICGTTVFTITTEDNPSASTRAGIVTIGNETLTVEQAALSITVEPSSLSVDPEGETVDIIVTANASYSITSDSWITVSAASGSSGETTFSVTVEPNAAETYRVGYIYVGYQMVTVMQSASEEQNKYLRFNILSGGTLVWKATDDTAVRTIEYSRNSGSTWSYLTSLTGSTSQGVNYINVDAGESIWLKGTNSNYSTGGIRYSSFKDSTARFDILGNIMSLIYGDNFRNQTALVSGNTFSFIFNNTKVKNAESLFLPAVELTQSCYSFMFYFCPFLETAPSLPATTLAADCYSGMFGLCSSLQTAPALPAITLAVNCYGNMFDGCTSLTEAPALPATTLAESGYSGMFRDCTSLTEAPALTAVTLADSCYLGMFSGCTSLATAPSLPATALTPHCYADMFQGCSSLSAAPSLPATELAAYCYHRMFGGCVSLTSAPALPATNLAAYCYNNMFLGCTSLTAAPALSATALTSNCYRGMFRGCTSLQTAPSLPATEPVEDCYKEMFSGCTSLNYIKCLLSDPSGCTMYWTLGVYNGGQGTFVKNPAATTWTRGQNGIPNGWTVEDDGDYIRITPSAATVDDYATSVTLTVSASTNYTISTNDSWITLPASSGASGESTVLVAISENTGSTRNGSITFSNGTISKTFSLIQQVPDYSQKYFTLRVASAGTIEFNSTVTGFTPNMSYSLNEGTWYGLSSGDSIPVSAGDEVRFKGTNTRLAESTTLHTSFGGTAVVNVFGCIMSLLVGDNYYEAQLSSTVVRAFGGLFKNNSNLRSARNLILPSNNRSHTYNQAFSGCTSLEDVPVLPATTVFTSCYADMFRGCTSLTTAPDLIASGTASKCYSNMFNGCHNLNYVRCLATDVTSSDSFGSWLVGVASTGTFVGYSTAQWSTGSSGVPSGWTFVEDA